MAKNSITCLTCQHRDAWHYPAAFDQPEDSGYDCGAEPNHLESDWAQELMGAVGTLGEEAQAIANQCPGYEYFDWDRHEYEQDQGMAEQMAADAKLADEYFGRK